MNETELVLRLVGQRIKEIRKAQSLSQEELGEKAGFHYTYIGSVERGEANITLKNLTRISNTLGVHLSDLLRYNDSIKQYIDQNKESELLEIFDLIISQDVVPLSKIRNIINELLS
ncbi:helix-turn-helix domain-containing protein [Cohnella phaseoli]|uniref:Helix-turn-helix protein n=1 Tax=Cohnella phaseoli TaxID=456490 RepID=A0A3D9KR36_9BACL|nr:helix-turn-helix transcriptional regulator [Cohnella phaseoli]RED89173.1 helix-turn-helix protein [Cohnella phaseoli]